ncbi:MAG: hypothetical protein U0835_03250 [Isosphaeraceae bacterium]
MAALAERLPAFLKGEDRSKDPAEGLGFAEICNKRSRYATAAHLWSEALKADPKLGGDRLKQPRYNAACAAALAAAGQGKDEPPPDDDAKAKLRGQALGWLRAELAAWKLLGETQPQARPAVIQTLQHWQEAFDLTSVRDREALAKLPQAERQAWEALWAEVEKMAQTP